MKRLRGFSLANKADKGKAWISGFEDLKFKAGKSLWFCSKPNKRSEGDLV